MKPAQQDPGHMPGKDKTMSWIPSETLPKYLSNRLQFVNTQNPISFDFSPNTIDQHQHVETSYWPLTHNDGSIQVYSQSPSSIWMPSRVHIAMHILPMNQGSGHN